MNLFSHGLLTRFASIVISVNDYIFFFWGGGSGCGGGGSGRGGGCRVGGGVRVDVNGEVKFL